MKRDGKYRFSLQFSDTTEENRVVGELLERMGNRKSTLIVDAVRVKMETNEMGSMPVQFLVLGVGTGIGVGVNSVLSKKLGERMQTV